MLVSKPFEKFLLLPPKFFTTTTADTKPHLLHNHHVKFHFQHKAHFKSTTLSSSPLSPAPAPAPAPQPSDSLPFAAGSSSSSVTTTVDFLMDSGGLSYVQAFQVIQQNPNLLSNGGRKPRSVIAYFESIGFSKTHISKLIFKLPRVLVADVEKTLKPKIQIFHDFGFCKESDIADLIASNPQILTRGVETHIKPALDLIKSVVKTDEDLLKIIKRTKFLLGSGLRKNIEPNIHVLRQHGVPDSEITHFILYRVNTLMSTPKRFKRIVKRIVSLGFKPESSKFSRAVFIMCALSNPIWDSKIDLLKTLGWSDEQILDAFRDYPEFLQLSGENLTESIEFYKETLNWDASFLSCRPIILNYSLKKRVLPRYAVLKCLMSKDIIKRDKLCFYMFKMTETLFLSKYVFEYQDQLPYLYEVYQNECMLGCKEENNGEITTNQQDHGDVVDMAV